MADKTAGRRAARAIHDYERARLWGHREAERDAERRLARATRDMARETGERAPPGWRWVALRDDYQRPWDATASGSTATLLLVRGSVMIYHGARNGVWRAVTTGGSELGAHVDLRELIHSLADCEDLLAEA